MKKFLLGLLAVTSAFFLAACKETTLRVTFVPSRDAENILTTVGPLEKMLLEKMKEKGITKYSRVKVNVSASYIAAGEALDAGTTDIAFLPGGTYAEYSKDGNIDVALAATRDGLSKDSANAKDWNDGKATTPTTEQVTYYRSIVVAGPSAAGKALAAKVNSGAELTWNDVKDLKWGVQGATSSAGYVYPAVWLKNKFGKVITDLSNPIAVSGYGSAAQGLAAGTYDVVAMYADARRDYAANWNATGDGNYGRDASIWEETNVVIVTDGIFNDTISISKKTVDADLKKVIQDAFIELAKTDEGKKVFAIYSHSGYKVVTDSDYDAARIAQEILNSK